MDRRGFDNNPQGEVRSCPDCGEYFLAGVGHSQGPEIAECPNCNSHATTFVAYADDYEACLDLFHTLIEDRGADTTYHHLQDLVEQSHPLDRQAERIDDLEADLSHIYSQLTGIQHDLDNVMTDDELDRCLDTIEMLRGEIEMTLEGRTLEEDGDDIEERRI